jgi:HEAT repeat protein
MKAQLTKTVLTLVAGLVLILSNNLFAQNTLAEFTNHKYALDNLIMGIHSENEGVRKSAIYFAGKYKVEETAVDLINQLNKEENPSVKILIALALFEMGSREGLEAVRKLSVTEGNPRVRKMATFIYNESVSDNFEGKVTSR